MKRFLLLFCTAVLCCALIAVPVLAYDTSDEPYLVSEYANENMVIFDDPIEDGYYTLTVAFTDDLIPFIQTPVFEITESVDFTFYNVLYPNEQFRLWGGLQDDGTYSFFLVSLFGDGDFEYMVPSEPCYDFYVALYSESEPSPNEGFWSDIGSFFKQSMIWLSAVANVVVQSPALLVLTIGIAVILFIVFAVQRIKNQ